MSTQRNKKHPQTNVLSAAAHRYPFLAVVSALKRALLDFVFPLSCLGCHQDDTLLCDTCCTRLTPSLEQRCPFCWRHITPHGETCFACSSRHALDGVFHGYDYTIPLIKTAIHIFKYQSVTSLADPLGTLLIRAVRSADIPLPDIIVPVPLYAWRLRYRGFNQSELLGHQLASSLLPGTSIPFSTTYLIRTRFTLPQQKMLSAKARRDNIKNAFTVPKGFRKHLTNKRIWLIDDVATTGSTLDACAQALKKAGARHVFGITLAGENYIRTQKTS